MTKRILFFLIKAYRLLLSPWLGSSCRFEPTCSQYALTAIEKHGASYGSLLTTWRLLRCHPWCQGGHDPVPDEFSPGIRGLFSQHITPQDQQDVKSVSSLACLSSNKDKMT